MEEIFSYFTLVNVMWVAVGVLAGIYIGAIPGLSVTMAASLLIGMTFDWDTGSALALMMGVYMGGVYGGSRAAILLNIPGAPAAVATTFDGYPLAKKGEAGKAIAVSTIISVLGGLVGLAILLVAAPAVGKLALSFGPKEYFLLVVMGLFLVGSLGGKSMAKGMFTAAMGLMLAVVGTDPITGLGRFTFGNTNMRSGISYITVMIGVFGIGEALMQLQHREEPVVKQKLNKVRPPFATIKKLMPLGISSAVIGTVVGALPGAGGDIAALLSYDVAKRTTKDPEVPFGEGAFEGVVAPEAANNAAVGGALIPMLTLGIPGDSVTAIMMGALTVHGVRCGPMIMTSQPWLFYTLAWMLAVACIFLLIFGMSGIRVFAKLVEVPREILMPLIIVISIVGSYAITNNVIDIIWTVVFGFVGYLLKYYGFPVAPLVLGLILGPNLELNFRRAMMSAGSFGGLVKDIFTSPVSLVLVGILVLLVVSQVKIARSNKKAEKQN